MCLFMAQQPGFSFMVRIGYRSRGILQSCTLRKAEEGELAVLLTALLLLKSLSGLLLIMQFVWHFIGLISSPSPCAYVTGFWRYGPWNNEVFGIVQKFICRRTCPQKLVLVWFHPNLQEWSVPSLAVHSVNIFQFNDFWQLWSLNEFVKDCLNYSS